jgi:hypothetical protein
MNKAQSFDKMLRLIYRFKASQAGVTAFLIASLSKGISPRL